MGEAVDYCKSFTAQTVTQGANRPIRMDGALKQRIAFFYWHCMFANEQMVLAFGDGGGNSPGYTALGAASPDHPANVSGGWTLSLQEQAGLSALMAMQAEAQSCSFTQSGNAVSGTCMGRFGSGVVTGIVDGRQVRWAWKREDGRRQGEVDFIGMIGADGVITGQSIVVPEFGSSRIAAFTATPGPGPVASQK
jgi:hypothetical protein